jgi:hypothetical protein
MALQMTLTSSQQLTLRQEAREWSILFQHSHDISGRSDIPKNSNSYREVRGRSDPSIWYKMYSIAARAYGGNEDHMSRYFPLVMGKAPLPWLDNL